MAALGSALSLLSLSVSLSLCLSHPSQLSFPPKACRVFLSKEPAKLYCLLQCPRV